MSFFDRKEVRDILSYLKVIDNPHDEPALMRIINQPARGIGNAAQKRLFEEATARGKFLWDVLPDALVIDGVDAKTAAAVAQFRRLIEELRDSCGQEDRRSPKSSQQVLDKTGYRDSLVKQYPDPAERESRLASLEEIINAAANYDKNSRSHRNAAEPCRRLPRRHAAQRARRQRRERIATRPQCGGADDAPQCQGARVPAASISWAWKRAFCRTSAPSTRRTTRRSTKSAGCATSA